MTDTLRNTVKRFLRHQRGDTAIIFALAIVPLLLAGGVAIDYVRYESAKTALQAALDSGALAAAAADTLNTAQRKAAAEATFNRNIGEALAGDISVTHSFKITASTVSATASLTMPAALMQLAGIDAMAVTAVTEVAIPEKQRAEIALVLDYSGSMNDVLGGQVKYIAMKDAAKKLVNDLVAANPKNVKFGLVPFSHHVWVTLPKSAVLGQTGAGTWTGCTQDRKYPYNLTDDAPTTNNDTKWGQPIAAMHLAWGCSPYVPNHLVVAPLTDDFASITNQLDDMVPYMWTHIALGAEFGFQLLSPNPPFGQAASYSDKTTRKFMVLLTDGEQTEPAFGPGGSRTVWQGEPNLEDICTNAKTKGITVITIAYNIDDAATVNRLRNCTTDPTRDFHQIGDNNDIAGAFEDIKKQIASVVRISK